MCRILAGVTQGPFPPGLLAEFGDLARTGDVLSAEDTGHPDGWGITTFDDGAWGYVGREAETAEDNSKFTAAVRKVEARTQGGVVIAHLRAASEGAINIENTHPFLHDGWSFCHNGTIFGLKLPVHPMRGRTDSEWMMLQLIKAVNAARSPMEGYRQGLRAIADEHEFTSLTTAFSDGERLLVSRVIGSVDNYPREKLAHYYMMWYQQQTSAVVLCQQPLGGGRWVQLKDRSLIEVGPDLSITIEDL